jgi:hypothetical protein
MIPLTALAAANKVTTVIFSFRASNMVRPRIRLQSDRYWNSAA